MRHSTRLLPLLATAILAVPATATAAVTHTVRRGETLTSIAATDGLSVARLAAANGLSSQAQLVAGTQLVIPPQSGPLAATPAESWTSASSSEDADAAPSQSAGGGYVVRYGDTLSAIAARFGTSASAIAAANGLSVNGLLLAGRTLAIPGGSAEATEEAPAAPAGGAQAVEEFVSAGEVGSIAEADGVPAPLAEAIADEESGFNDDEVSSTGATGVMQLEPATWNDLTRVDGLDLSPDSALDNVRGGVALLRSLLIATGENQDTTIAAYYQGLRSVRARGVFASTRHYVRDVLALESRFGG